MIVVSTYTQIPIKFPFLHARAIRDTFLGDIAGGEGGEVRGDESLLMESARSGVGGCDFDESEIELEDYSVDF